MKPKPHNDYWASHPPRKRRVFYIHTIEGRPGEYVPGKQIYFAINTRPVPLVATLDQIIKEQKKSLAWRKKQCCFSNVSYGYMKVKWRGE